MKTSHKLAGLALVAAAAGAAVVAHLADADRLDFDTGCVQALSPAAGPGGVLPATYTGSSGLWPWEWGFIAVDWNPKSASWKNGVGKVDPPFCQPSVQIIGDCWQSVAELAASPGSRKWVVAPQSAVMCGTRGAQVWKFETGAWRWKGLVAANVRSPGGVPTIDGDFAYLRENVGGATPSYVKIDLAALAVAATGLTSRPEFVPQATLPDGSRLRLFADHPSPIPPGYPGPRKFHVMREGAPPPPTPGPTPIPTADPFAAWDEQLAREGITAGCGAGKFCPDRQITREEAAVWILKAMHGATYLPPPCTGMFVDVPCAP